jgi:hypothetical protein
MPIMHGRVTGFRLNMMLGDRYGPERCDAHHTVTFSRAAWANERRMSNMRG